MGYIGNGVGRLPGRGISEPTCYECCAATLAKPADSVTAPISDWFGSSALGIAVLTAATSRF